MVVGVYTLVLAIVCTYCFNCLKYNGLKIGRDNISLSDTAILKGIAILMVVVGHIGQVIPGLRVFTPLGAMGVGIFLICSGYGIEKSFSKNGRKHYWYKRLINVWLPYAIIELWALPLNWNLGRLAVVEDFLLIAPLHPFGWYMRYLFVWYILYYVYSFAGKYLYILLIATGIIIYMSLDSLYAQNAFSFAIGVGLARMSSLDSILKKRYVWIGLVLSVVLFVVRDYTKKHYHDIHLLWNTVSCLYNLALVMTSVIGYKVISNAKVKLPYKGLCIIGVFSYELYLIHGYAYQILISPANILMVTEFAAVCIIATYLLNKVNRLIITMINKFYL